MSVLQNQKEETKKRKGRAGEDQELVRRCIEDKDQLAYAELLKRYKDSIYFTVYKMVNSKEDADDLTIEAFGKAFNNIEKYSPNYAFSTWLFKIAINNCIDFIRKKRLHFLSIDEPVKGKEEGSTITYNIKSSQLSPEERFIKEQRKQLLNEVVDRLPDNYKRLIQLRFFKEFSYDEIATELQIPLGTVKAQLFRAKELLYNILKNTTNKF